MGAGRPVSAPIAAAAASATCGSTSIRYGASASASTARPSSPIRAEEGKARVARRVALRGADARERREEGRRRVHSPRRADERVRRGHDELVVAPAERFEVEIVGVVFRDRLQSGDGRLAHVVPFVPGEARQGFGVAQPRRGTRGVHAHGPVSARFEAGQERRCLRRCDPRQRHQRMSSPMPVHQCRRLRR